MSLRVNSLRFLEPSCMDRSLRVTRQLSAVAAFLLCCALDVGASIVSEAPRPVIVEGRVVGLDDLVATAAAAYIVNVEEIVSGFVPLTAVEESPGATSGITARARVHLVLLPKARGRVLWYERRPPPGFGVDAERGLDVIERSGRCVALVARELRVPGIRSGRSCSIAVVSATSRP